MSRCAIGAIAAHDDGRAGALAASPPPPVEESTDGPRAPPVSARRLVPAPREGGCATARRLGDGLRRPDAALRRAARPHRVAAAPRAALPPAPRRGPARAGPAGLGRRPALQPALPP